MLSRHSCQNIRDSNAFQTASVKLFLSTVLKCKSSFETNWGHNAGYRNVGRKIKNIFGPTNEAGCFWPICIFVPPKLDLLLYVFFSNHPFFVSKLWQIFGTFELRARIFGLCISLICGFETVACRSGEKIFFLFRLIYNTTNTKVF